MVSYIINLINEIHSYVRWRVCIYGIPEVSNNYPCIIWKIKLKMIRKSVKKKKKKDDTEETYSRKLER